MKKYLPYFTITLLLLLASLWTAPANAAKQPELLFAPEQSALALAGQLYGDLWRRTELYFGSQKPDGAVVTEAEFEQFVDDVITPRFPDGLTLLTGYGQSAIRRT